MTLETLRGPDTALLKVEEPEQLAAPSGPAGPDVVGLQLGMSFAAADAAIRRHMNVAHVFTADRAWQANAVANQLRPFTSGRLYIAEGGKEIIAIYDEPPSAPEVVMGLLRQVSLPKGQVPANALYAKLRQKYGQEVHADQMGLFWGEAREDTGDRAYPIAYCLPRVFPRSMDQTWRTADGQPALALLTASGGYRPVILPHDPCPGQL